MNVDEQRYAIIGFGTMGQAIWGGLKGAALSPEMVRGSVRDVERAQALSSHHGIEVGVDNNAIAQWTDVVLLAVKPQIAKSVCTDPELVEALAGKVLISICAGVRGEQLGEWLPNTAIVRAMPNTPCTIGEGMTIVCAGPRATKEQLELAQSIFSCVGRSRILEEKYLDAVTGLGGSGPAFACVLLEAMADGGVMMGLPRDIAVEIAAQTMQGAARMVLASGEHPAALKDRVTTPAGCTIAGLLTMEDGRVRSTLARTIQEATNVAASLGQDE